MQAELTAEQAKSLDNELGKNDKYMIYKIHLLDRNGWFGKSEGLNGLSVELLLKALLNGYVTKEEN